MHQRSGYQEDEDDVGEKDEYIKYSKILDSYFEEDEELLMEIPEKFLDANSQQ